MSFSDWLLKADYGVALPAMARLPLGLAYSTADLRALWTMRRRADSRRESLRRMAEVFPDKSRGELERIVARQFRVQSRDEMESHWYRRPWSFFERFVRIDGLETLRGALDEGRGVVLFSGHLGCTGLFFVVLGLHGIRLNIVAFPQDSEQMAFPEPFLAYAANRVAGIEAAVGEPFIWTGRGNFPVMLQKLEAGRPLLILIDVIPALLKRRVAVNFLGRSCWLGDGAASLCRSAGARLLEWHIHQDLDTNVQHIEILDPGLGDLAEQSNETVMGKLAARLERRIRLHPEDWSLWDSLVHFRRERPDAPPEGD